MRKLPRIVWDEWAMDDLGPCGLTKVRILLAKFT